MKKCSTPIYILITIFAAAGIANTLSFAAQASSEKPFVVFNSLHYRNTPDLSKEGFHNIRLIYENKLTIPPRFGIGERLFSASSIISAASLSKGEPNTPVSMDIESWKLSTEAVQKYMEAIRVFRNASPHSKIGLYGFIPFANKLLYQSIDTNDPKLRIRWENMQKQAIPVAKVVDIFMPSLYTWGKDINAWKSTARIAIQQARSTNSSTPIYVYIWPQYYSNNQPYALQFIDTKTWQIELDTLYQLADGIIIWSSDKNAQGKPIQFSTSMPWYVTTVSFMKRHNIH
jgi:hypothetical protein